MKALKTLDRYLDRYIFFNHDFFIRTKTKNGEWIFKRMKNAKSLNLDNELDLFLHKVKKKGLIFYTVSEAASGGRIVKLYRKPAIAIKNARKLLDDKGASVVIMKVTQHVNSSYLSPRFKHIANPTRKTIRTVR